MSYLDYIAMYDDGICNVRPGWYSITLQVSDINYQAARMDEKLDIFARYGEILNSIDPTQHIQISMINRSMDQAQFWASMFLPEQAEGSLLGKMGREMNAVLADKVLEGQNGILHEKYFTITVEAPDYLAAKAALSRLETDYTGNFKNLGCDVVPLTGLQRLMLIHYYTRHGDPFRFDYEQLLESKLTTKHAVAPMSLDFSARRTFRCGDQYGEVLVLRDLPARMSDQLVSKIMDLPFDLTITLHIDRIDQAKALEQIHTQIAFMEMEQSSQQTKAYEKGYDPMLSTPREMRRNFNGAKKLLRDIEDRDQRFFKVTILIYTSAESCELLNERVLQICGVCAQKSCTPTPLVDRQREGFNSTMPFGCNSVDIRRSLTTQSAAIFIPFTTQELYQPGGIFYGLNAMSHNMIFFSRYSLDAPSGWILGKPGSGKSMTAKLEMINVLLSDPNAEVIVIDPEREYARLCDEVDGEYIRISAGAKNYLNPMDITEDYADDDDPLLLKTEFILSVVELICGGREGLSAGERSVVSRACALCYRPFFSNPKRKEPPTLKDFYEVLKAQPEPEARSMALALEVYIEGALSVFAHQTNVNPNKRFVVYDIKDLGKQLRTLGMLVVQDQIWNRITRNRARGIRTWFYTDEIQLVFSNEQSANYYFEMYSRARKWGAVPTGITQNVETLLLSDLARRMLSNSDFVVLLNQAQPDRIELAGLLQISNKQLSYVTNVPAGHGLLVAGKAIVPFVNEFPKDTEIYRCITTKPGEEQQQAQGKEG